MHTHEAPQPLVVREGAGVEGLHRLGVESRLSARRGVGVRAVVAVVVAGDGQEDGLLFGPGKTAVFLDEALRLQVAVGDGRVLRRHFGDEIRDEAEGLFRLVVDLLGVVRLGGSRRCHSDLMTVVE